MSMSLHTTTQDDGSTTLSPKLHRLQGCSATKRIEELEAVVAGLRAALDIAQTELQRERSRPPKIGDFVRCPLTNFFGQVKRVTPRPAGRPWVEITPYLAKDLPGKGIMDLYDNWELIDPPARQSAGPAGRETMPRLPSVFSFKWPGEPAAAPKPAKDAGR